MPFPPSLEDSLKHVAVIGRYRWYTDGTEVQRRISLPGGTKFEEANKAIGFELAFGPHTFTISGKTFEGFAVAPPRYVEEIWGENKWGPSQLEKVRSISLTDQKPLIASLAKGES